MTRVKRIAHFKW